MKKNIIFCYFLLFSLPFLAAQPLPLMRSHQKVVRLREGNKEIEWTISPELKPDTWQVQCGNKRVKVVFYSDCDSIAFEMKKDQKVQFYLLLNEKDSALTELVGVGKPEKQDFQYEISPVFEQKRLKTLQINFTFQGNKRGETELNYPDEHWGDKGLQRGLVFVESPQKEVSIRLDYRNNKVIIKHLSSQKVTIRYQLAQTFNDSITGKKGHLPLIQPSYFHLMDNTFFMYPLNADYSEIKHNFTLKWKDFPSNWLIHNSFAPTSRTQKLFTTLQSFQHGVWLGGDFRKYTIKVKDKPIYVAIRGNWQFEKEKEFISVLKKTIPQQRKFWQDYSDKYFNISILPTYSEWNEEHKRFGVLGTGLTSAFACFISNNEGLADNWGKVEYLFNHELMHNWIGHKIQNSSLETLDYWFSEGFTDYFCYKNMLSAGIINKTQWLEKMNEIYKSYQLSPVKNMPNDSITTYNFWHSADYEKLPYKRGLLFAFALDMKIKVISQNAYSLNNVMWDLLRHCETRKQPFNRAIFLELAKKYAQTDLEDFFNAHIIRGEDFDFTKTTLLRCLQIDVSENIAKWKLIDGNENSEIVN